jgi:pimeloyl-ACP methyl ester carboxylesterase
LLRDVVFTEYTPLSSNLELARRLLTPLAAASVPQRMAGSGKRLAEQPIDLSEERFIIYVPPAPPPQGYGLLAFVPPWPQASLPPGWAATLDRQGVIFVSAARSGNDASVLARREPLALLAAHNIMQRYPVDPERVYVSGFSGGARVAMRLGLGYPDLFRGAILNAGSDPIGSAEIPLPPKDLLLRFQSSTRIVYLTGERDDPHVSDDSVSMHSMRQWCVLGVEDFITPRVGHTVADGPALSRALDAMRARTPSDPDQLARCRAAIETELAKGFERVDALIAGGRDGEAEKLLHKLDERFGGLAAPRSLELARKYFTSSPP